MALPCFLESLTSLWGPEVDGVAAGAVAPSVEGHDDEAVLRVGRQARHHAVVPVARERHRLFAFVASLGVGEAPEAPPAQLAEERERAGGSVQLLINFAHKCKHGRITNEELARVLFCSRYTGRLKGNKVAVQRVSGTKVRVKSKDLIFVLFCCCFLPCSLPGVRADCPYALASS